MGMFDSIECNYPLPLPLEVVDVMPDPYDQEFQTKDLENLLDLYYLNEDGVLYWRKRKYEWKDDDNAFLLENIEVLSYEIRDATVRIIDLKNTMKKHEERRNRWYNKYIFYTKYWRFIKNKIILNPIDLLRKFLDKLYWLIVRYL
jgi:hypothetical protein